MGVLCCYFRPKMFSPGDHVRYHSKPAAKRTGLAVQEGAKAAAKPAPRAIASSSSASATHPVPNMQTEHMQQFKVCYSRTQKFFTVPLDPQ